MSCLELIGKQGTESLLEDVSQIDGVRECVVLRTCNRVEMYTVSSNTEATRDGLERLISKYIPFDTSENLVQYLSGKDSIRHLFRVTSGLESLIVGEDQIQSQVKEAFQLAERNGYTGEILSEVFRKALSVGKKVRTETRLNKGAVSVGSAAVDLAERILGDLQGLNILVIGAGETATLIARHLVGKGPNTVFVSNRTYERAVKLAWQLGGKAIRFNGLWDYLPNMDIVLVATSSPHILLDRERMTTVMEKRGMEPLVIIDLSLPRNVDPDVASLEGVKLYDIDSLRGIATENMMQRIREIRAAERIVIEELELLNARLEELKVSDLISALHIKYRTIKEREVRKAINRLNGTDDGVRILQEFADSLMGKFLADPTTALKAASREGNEEVIRMAGHIFRLWGKENVS